MSPLNALILGTEDAADEADVFEQFEAFVADYGFDCLSYHLLKDRLQRVPFEDGFIVKDFPASWVKHYSEMDYFQIDPIIAHATVSARPFGWYQVEDLVALSPEQRAYLDDMRAYGLVDGLAVPINGPLGNVAYFGLGSTKRILNLSVAEQMLIQCACMHVHNCFMHIRQSVQEVDVKLSPREREVLTWIARGKSNSVIAEILEVSDHTIDTLVRRAFNKLQVGDRVSAALRGAALNLIEV